MDSALIRSVTPRSKSSRDAFTVPTITLFPRTKPWLILSAGTSALRSPPVTLASTRTPFLPSGSARLPDSQPPLDLVRLVDPLLGHRRRLEQDADLAQRLGQRDHVLRILDVALGEVPVQQVDPALVVRVVGGHVLEADLVVDRVARAADGRNDESAWLNRARH